MKYIHLVKLLIDLEDGGKKEFQIEIKSNHKIIYKSEIYENMIEYVKQKKIKFNKKGKYYIPGLITLLNK